MIILRLLTAILCLALVVPQGHTQEFTLHHNHNHHNQTEQSEQRIDYVCPMHSHIVSDEPGSCPICGMDLEPRQHHAEKSVQVSSSMQQNLAIRTTTVQYDTLWRYYPTIAQVAWTTMRVTMCTLARPAGLKSSTFAAKEHKYNGATVCMTSIAVN